MYHIKQKTISSVLSKIPLTIVGKLIQINFIIVYYHVVSNSKVPHIIHLYDYKNINQFENDMEVLLKNFSPINLFELIKHLKNDIELPKKAFLLTFDDGFREMYDIVAPILLRKGIPATFFVNSDFIDNKRLCYLNEASILVWSFQKTGSFKLEEKIKKLLSENGIISNDIKSGVLSIKYHQKDLITEIAKLMNIDFSEYLLKNEPYLSSDQINKLIADGFTIGAHSIDHPLYSELSLKDQLHQTTESIRYIREKFCLSYGAFAFPHSDNRVPEIFFSELYSSGLVDITFGTSGLLDDACSYNFQRISLEKPNIPANRIIAIQFLKRFVRERKGNYKIKRK